jgi:MFS family permease
MSPLARRLAIALGTTQILAWSTTFYIPATMLGAVSETLGASKTMLLAAFSWSLLVASVCAPRIGRFIDANGGKPILIAGALITCAGLTALAGAQSLLHWFAAWTVLGVGMALGLYDTTFATIGRILGRDSRPAIVGVTLIAGFASTVGFPAGTWLVHLMGWRWAVLVYAAVQVVLVLPLILIFVPASPGSPPLGAARETPAGGRLPGRLEFVLMAVFFTSRAGIGALISVHALVLLQGLGLSLDAAVGVASLIGAAQVGARLLDVRFGRGLSPVTSGQIGAMLMPVGIVATLLGAPTLVFAISYGMSNGIFTISRGTLPMHVFGPAGYATLLGRLALPSLIAQALIPTLLAPAVDSLPAAWVFGGMAVLSFAAFACLLPLRR